MVINRIGPFSCAKIVGTLYLLLGIVVGAVVSLVAVAGGLASDDSGPHFMGAVLGVGSIVFFPLLYGCLGFFSALIGAWLYNLLAGAIGGIQMDVQ